MRHEQYKKKRALDYHIGFVQKFVTSNGLQYPCHPEDVSRHSQFPLDFRRCFGCGSEQHSFSDCLTKRENTCCKNFHWNLHCHKPDIFFRNRKGKANTFKAQRQTSSLSSYMPSQKYQQQQQQPMLTFTQGYPLQQQASTAAPYNQYQQPPQAPLSAIG